MEQAAYVWKRRLGHQLLACFDRVLWNGQLRWGQQGNGGEARPDCYLSCTSVESDERPTGAARDERVAVWHHHGSDSQLIGCAGLAGRGGVLLPLFVRV